ncbi:MAG: 4Fe-4S binding protein [Synechococcaceae cyanobacterium SM2_3_1]|nr:4Fe-4S binding protein [Synechococcaceae cyanobacterium SM2_3_1]
MAYRIPEKCTGCNTCLPHCPTNAISVQEGEYWIDPILCNNCEGYYPEPQCLVNCPDSIPLPYEAMRGRTKSISARIASSPTLFPDGKSHPFSSSIVVWEACNLLAQRDSLPLEISSEGRAYYCKRVNKDQGLITLSLPVDKEAKEQGSELNFLDLRASCLHLIFAAYATGLEKPWEQPFVVTDQQLESYLGLDKRKDLSKIVRLTLLKTLIEQACLMEVAIEWPQQGKVKSFSTEAAPLWHLLKIHHHFQKDDLGCNHLIGLTFVIYPGLWSRYFLNRQGCRLREAFYQYSGLPLSLLSAVMSNWQHHEGGVRILLWLVFKTRMGRKQRITVPTLMRIAYGEKRLLQANTHSQEQSRLIRIFESDLGLLARYGVKPVFDPITYPPTIQPLWSRLEAVPEDGEEALDFWIEDAHSDSSLTAASPRGKWNLLMYARIEQFELPPDWLPQMRNESPKPQSTAQRKQHRSQKYSKAKLPTHSISAFSGLTGSDISKARQRLGFSQRDLALRTGKSQSWIRDIENERFQARAADQQILREILELGECRA